MKHVTHRDIAKVLVGLALADLISVLFFGNAGLFPLTILGVTWTSAAIVPIVVFDAAIILLLVHYGWSMKLPLSSPSERTLLVIAGIIFLAVALAHLARLALGIDIALGDFAVPLWLSWIGFLVAGYLSYASFHFALRAKR